MRPIKFRAWDTHEEVTNRVDYIDFAHGVIGLSNENVRDYEQPIHRVELIQYTGLLDKNGVEIYGGCVVILEDYFKGTIRAKVVKENGAWGLVGIDRDIIEIVSTNWNDHFLTFALLVWEYEHPKNQLFNVEVIGDIYQNPKLLEESK